MSSKFEIKPQPGPQTTFLSTPADIAIYGGSAGGGKTFSLLMEPLRHLYVPDFNTVIFRRNTTQVTNPGGLWAQSYQIYPHVHGTPREAKLDWIFPSKSRLKFSHLEYAKNIYDWQGTEVPLIMFDELTHFTKDMFFYLLSRNRSLCGVKPYVRCSTNPDCDSWVRKFINWWIDNDSGLAIPERSGVIRYFVRVNDEIFWANTRAELIAQFGPEIGSFSKSVTFINASIYDNKILMEKDPSYLANLMAQSKVERERLLSGNWNIRPAAGNFFKRSYFEIVDVPPAERETIRYWDRAATEKTESNNPDWTVGLKLSKDYNGLFYIEHIERFRHAPHKTKELIKNTASRDGVQTKIGLEQDPGQAGKVEVQFLAAELAGYNVIINKVTKKKIKRAEPVSAQAEAGNIKVVKGDWNDSFFNELENFPDGEKDDQVDALSGAFNELNVISQPRISLL